MSTAITENAESLFIADGMKTREETAAWLKISKISLYRLEKSGQLLPLRIGTRLVYDPIEILNYVEKLKKQRDNGQSTEDQEQSGS